MSNNCINTCFCSRCSIKKPLQFHISIDPLTHPQEYEIALIAKRQRGFNKLFREFLKEYALAVSDQAKQ